LKTRILLGGLAALAVMAFGVASASATTINPQGPFAPLSSSVTFKVADVPFTCTSSTIPGTVNSNGTITGGKPTFAGCTSVVGAAEVVANKAATYALAFKPTGLETTLGSLSLNFKLPSKHCSFNVEGSESTENVGPSPIAVSKLAFSNGTVSSQPASLRITSFPITETRFCQNLVAGQPYVPFAATYTLSPSLVVSK
jgi:hypothetical protein